LSRRIRSCRIRRIRRVTTATATDSTILSSIRTHGLYYYGFNNPVKYTDPTGHCVNNYEIGSADMDTCVAAWNAVVNYIDGVVFGPGGSGDFPNAGVNEWLLNADIATLESLMEAWGIGYGYTWNPPAEYATSGRYGRRNLRSRGAMAEVCHYWQSCFEPVVTGEEMKPDAIAVGLSGSVAGVAYGVVGGEVVYNLDTREKSLFSYTGQGAGVALEGDVSGYGALIWNLDETVDYEGVSPTLTVDLGAGVHGQFSLFWEAGTIPFTGDTWGISLGPGGGGGFGLTGSFADYTCQAGCR